MTATNGLNRAKIVDMIGLLVRAPRTIDELAELTGMNRTAIHRWLRLLLEEQLIRRESIGRFGRHFRYFWRHPDA